MDSFLTDNETETLIQNLTYFCQKCDSNSYTYIKNTLDQLYIPFAAISIIKGKLLFRARRHLKKEILFNEISDISYRQDIFNITEFGRANEPCQSIFYCSDQHEIAVAETSPIIRNGLELENDTLTIGIWRVVKELRVASLLNYPPNGAQNPTRTFLDSKTKELLSSFRNEHTNQLFKLHRFITEEFIRPSADNPHNYLISCAFANYIYENSGFDTYLDRETNIDGIIYPSSIYPDSGMNLALKPNVVTEGKIVLIGSRKSKLVKKSETHFVEEETNDSIMIDVDQNKIIWVP